MATKQAEKPKMGKVMVVGGCGFLGHHIVNVLLRDYTANVSVVDLRCNRNRRPDSDGVRYIEADITDASRITTVFDNVRPDVVIHTASPLAQGSDAVAHALFKKVNVEGTQCIVDACRKARVKALVFTSSASIVSDNVSDLIHIDERWPVIRGAAQTEYYSETKAEAEEIVLQANEPTKLLTCSIRPSGIMGEGDAMAIHHMINIYRNGKDNIQVGENDNIFEFTYAENVAHAHLLAGLALLATHETYAKNKGTVIPEEHERVDGEAFFVTNDEPIYFWDFVRTVWKYAGSPKGTAHVWNLPKDVGYVLGYLAETAAWVLRRQPTFNRQRITYSCMTRYYNISKAKRRLGYEPLVSLEEGIRRGVEYALKEHPMVKA